MVSNERPNAKTTPKNPMPVWGKPAASTDLPHPVNTSQNVPSISAAAFLLEEIGKFFTSLLMELCGTARLGDSSAKKPVRTLSCRNDAQNYETSSRTSCYYPKNSPSGASGS